MSIQTDHFVDESELVTGLLNKLLDLAASELLLDGLPVLLFLAHLEPVPREALHGLPVPLVLRHCLDLLQRLRVELDQDLSGVRHHFQPHDSRRLFHLRQQWPTDRPQEHLSLLSVLRSVFMLGAVERVGFQRNGRVGECGGAWGPVLFDFYE